MYRIDNLSSFEVSETVSGMSNLTIWCMCMDEIRPLGRVITMAVKTLYHVSPQTLERFLGSKCCLLLLLLLSANV